MLTAPLAPFLHGVINRRVTESGEGNLAGRSDLMNDRTLVDEAQVEIQYIMADEQVAVGRQLPESFQDLLFVAVKYFNRGVQRRLDRVAQATNLCRHRRKAESFYHIGFVEPQKHQFERGNFAAKTSAGCLTINFSLLAITRCAFGQLLSANRICLIVGQIKQAVTFVNEVDDAFHDLAI